VRVEALAHGRVPGHLQQLAAGQERGTHEQAERAADVAEQVYGAVAHLLANELELQRLQSEGEGKWERHSFL